MNLDAITIETRVEKPWQALDIGIQLARRWWWPMFNAWFWAPALLFVLANIFLREHPFIALAVIWWLKPFWDRAALYYASRALFSAPPSVKAIYRNFFHIMRTDFFPWLLWRRIGIIRSFALPVTLLEGLTGRARQKRIAVLHSNNSGAPAGLTLVFFTFELILPFALLAIAAMFFPDWESLNYFGFNDWLSQHPFALWIICWVTLLGMAVVAPFYCACGFSLYIHRRIELEGWDIEISFRKMADKIHTPLVALLLAGLIQAQLWLAPSPSVAATAANDAATEETQQVLIEARSAIAQVFEGDDFKRIETVKHWRKKNRARNNDASWLEEFLEDLFGDEESQVDTPTLALVAKVLELILWGLVALLVAWLIYKYRHVLGLIKPTLPYSHKRDKDQPQVLFGLDLTPKSLPANIPAAVKALIGQQQFGEALALLYRASLSHFSHHDQVQIHKAYTELECEQAVANVAPEQQRSYFRVLTQAWLKFTYAHHLPSEAIISDLCEQWPSEFSPGGKL